MKELVYHRLFLPGLDAYADKPDTIIDGDYRSTLGQHADRVFRLAHALQHQLGVEPGDRFAVMALNSHQYLELYHAAFLGAGVINPLNLRLAPARSCEYILRRLRHQGRASSTRFVRASAASTSVRRRGQPALEPRRADRRRRRRPARRRATRT